MLQSFTVITSAGSIPLMARDFEHAQVQATELVGSRHKVIRTTYQKEDMWHT